MVPPRPGFSVMGDVFFFLPTLSPPPFLANTWIPVTYRSQGDTRGTELKAKRERLSLTPPWPSAAGVAHGGTVSGPCISETYIRGA